MHSQFLSLFAAGALLLGSGCYVHSAAAVTPSVGVSVTSFDPYLEPYGTWLDVPGYGRTWQPSPQYVGADFYPYGTGGHWLYTDAGWSFESDYPFGWAVFHYGRWMRHANYGWLWLPGNQWAPSWVTWRVGGPYVGWAPMGPRGALGFSYHDWCFVPASSFTVRNVRAYSTGYYDFHRAVGVTAPVRQARIGPPPRYIARATGVNIRPVPMGSIRSRVPPARPPPAPSTSAGPVQVRPPPPPTGWRSQPPPPGGFTRPAPTYRSPPPSTFSAPRSYQPAPPPMQAPGRVQPSAPAPGYRSAPPPAPSYRSAPAPAPTYRPAPAPAPSYRSAPAPAPSYRPPPSSYRSAPAMPSSRPAPPPPPRR